jgi:hypothetical protein
MPPKTSKPKNGLRVAKLRVKIYQILKILFVDFENLESVDLRSANSQLSTLLVDFGELLFKLKTQKL